MSKKNRKKKDHADCDQRGNDCECSGKYDDGEKEISSNDKTDEGNDAAALAFILNVKNVSFSYVDQEENEADLSQDSHESQPSAADLETNRQLANNNSEVIDDVLNKWKHVEFIPMTIEQNDVGDDLCPECGGKIRKYERYCAICGFNLFSINDPSLENDNYRLDSIVAVSKPGIGMLPKIALILLLVLGAGGMFWWFKGPELLVNKTISDQSALEQGQADASRFTQASSYMPRPGLDVQFYLRYPKGRSGTMERITAQVAANKSVITELELMEDKGKEYGYAYHLINNTDGLYIAYDQSPSDRILMLKNNLHPGLSWAFQDQGVSTVWKVLEMGKTIDLGFVSLENCLLIEEKSDAADYRKIIYYAPEIGRIMEANAEDGKCFMIMTSLGSITPNQAAKKVKKWAPNYKEIETVD